MPKNLPTQAETTLNLAWLNVSASHISVPKCIFKRKIETWEKCDLPKGKKTIACRWIFSIKDLADGTIDRFKASLVAQGYT